MTEIKMAQNGAPVSIRRSVLSHFYLFPHSTWGIGTTIILIFLAVQ
jgi:hypothetical protein